MCCLVPQLSLFCRPTHSSFLPPFSLLFSYTDNILVSTADFACKCYAQCCIGVCVCTHVCVYMCVWGSGYHEALVQALQLQYSTCNTLLLLGINLWASSSSSSVAIAVSANAGAHQHILGLLAFCHSLLGLDLLTTSISSCPTASGLECNIIMGCVCKIW